MGVRQVAIINGTAASETLFGTNNPDTINAGDGDDTLVGFQGDDQLNGGNGTDTAVVSDAVAVTDVTRVADADPATPGNQAGWRVTTANGGTDTLNDIEIIQGNGTERILLVGNGGYATIQEAINAANNGDTIMIGPGTYNESLTVNKDVSIYGANSGNAGGGPRGAETVITGGVTIVASGVSINGVAITGTVNNGGFDTGIVVQGNDFSLVNSVLDGPDAGVNTNYGIMTNGGVTGVNVRDNLVQGYQNAAYIAAGTAGSVAFNLFRGDEGNVGTGMVNGVLTESVLLQIANNTFDDLPGGAIFPLPFGGASVDLDTFIGTNTFVDGIARPIQIYPQQVTPSIIGTDYNEAFIGDYGAAGPWTFDGQGGDDRAWGSANGDTFNGGAGNDQLFGNDGDDVLLGNAGNDLIEGGNGNDELRGQIGVDTISGGVGDDDIFGGGDGDVLNGDAGLDVILGGAGTDVIFGGTEDDELRGQVGNDTIFGGAGNDRLFGGGDVDTLNGEAGNDQMQGGAGNDDLIGGDGNDTMDGEVGEDTLVGGAGNDTFVFAAHTETLVGAADRISDFTSGQDKIDVSQIDANFNVAGNQSFTYVGSAAFSGTAGELRAYDSGQGFFYVEGDVDGDGAADFQIEVVPPLPLVASDFVL
jgi:Ca2+-binding RTX toxin-like protein